MSTRSRAFLVVVFAFLAIPAVASAHLRTGTVAVDYRASILAQDTSAYTAQIYLSDRGLRLTVKPEHVVVMLGYLGEPVFRLDRAGLWVNAASPTAVVAGLLPKAQRVTASVPSWRLHRGARSATWHDARVQGLPPGVDHGSWNVPLIVDGHRTELLGDLQRFPRPSLWPWLAAVAALIAAAATPILTRRQDRIRRAAIALGLIAAFASVVIALAFVFDSYASPGTWIEGLDEIAFLAVGIGVLVKGPQNFHVFAAIGLGLVSVAVAISKGAAFLHPIVLASLPGTVVRVGVVVALGAGFGASLLGCWFHIETATPARGAKRDVGFPKTATPARQRPSA